MHDKKEWIKCSAVAIGFYIAVYVLFAHFYWGFFNIWLILGCIAFTCGDIWGLRWISREFYSDDDDDYYP